MKCPNCDHDKSSVKETRAYDDYIRRRRRCLSCAHMWTTYEVQVDGVRTYATGGRAGANFIVVPRRYASRAVLAVDCLLEFELAELKEA